MSISASSLPVSAVAAAWNGTRNNKNNKMKTVSARATRATRDNMNGENNKKKKKTPTTGALQKHLNILAKGGLENKIIKLLKDAAGQDETSTFDAIVEAVHAAVKNKTSETDVDGPDMSLVTFRELVACGAASQGMKNVRFVAVSAARICEKEIVNAIKAVSCAPPFTEIPQQDSPFHTQYQIKQVIDALLRPTQDPLDFLDELEATCPISTGLTGFDGLDVLMPAGLAAVVPTIKCTVTARMTLECSKNDASNSISNKNDNVPNKNSLSSISENLLNMKNMCKPKKYFIPQRQKFTSVSK
eukprot:PhM_4_TR8470/c4_g2_i1/m.104112